MSAVAIRFLRGGIHLPELGLWLDPHEPQSGEDRVFISHAHADHVGVHREIILSEPTSKLMRARIKGEWLEHVLPFGQRTEFHHGNDPYHLTLLPAGHIFGSAMAWIEAQGISVLYTGDFKMRRGLSAEPCEPRPADILIMETTYGRRQYRFPPTAEVVRGIIRFCREAITNDETPVLLGYSLGKSQEILSALAEAALPIMLHHQVAKLAEIYERLGHRFPPYEKLDATTAAKKVLLCPPAAINSAMFRSLGPVRTAILTGWAVDPNCRFRYRTDAAFPLSDHADFPDLMDFVEAVKPKKVYTLHGFAADFAQALRERGYDAEALSQEDQLTLPLPASEISVLRDEPSPAPCIISDPWASDSHPADRFHEAALPSEAATSPPGSFHAFATTCLNIGSTAKKLEKVRLLADYLRSLEATELVPVNTWMTGHPFPPSHNKVLQLGWAIIRDAVCTVSQIDQGEFGQVYLKHSDLGEAAFEILSEVAPSVSTLAIRDVGTAFAQLYAAKGPLAKVPVLIGALRRGTALEGKFLVKILTGDLRIGVKEGLVEEAIASAFDAQIDAVKNANLLLGDVGETAQLAQRRQLESATLVPFRPVKYMLASPEETAEAIWARALDWNRRRAGVSPAPPKAVETIPNTALQPEPEPAPPISQVAARCSDTSDPSSPPTVWIEDKYDGIRCQLHKVGDRVALFSRDLKEITPGFLELADAARSAPHDFVLDGEIIAMRGDQVLPFSELQRRIGRREADLFLGSEIPVRFIVFDLLWHGGQSYLNAPLSRRRKLLEQLPGLRLSQTTPASSPVEIEAAFDAARQRGNEGLVIKDPGSAYAPGRRGLAWLKLKKAYGTLDCIVVGAEYGHGKRRAVLSDYTFAVRDDATGQLKTIGKAFTGLTDDEIAQLTRHFLGKVIRQRGRLLDVEPDTILEIAFDAIQPSARHTSGLAMRFPRILRIRRDKSAAEIDTVSTARKFVKAAGDKPEETA